MLPLLFAASTGAAAAAVPTGDVVDATTLSAPHLLRKGLVVGLSLGGGLGGASGYPNNLTQIGNSDYYSASGWLAGTNETIFVMGALTDYFSFGFWFSHALYESPDWHSNSDGGGLRMEVFPFALTLPSVSSLAGLGVMAQFGLGSADLISKVTQTPGAMGTQSIAGVGVFYEWAFGHVLGGHFAVGPSLEFDALWSQPMEQHGLVASLRFAFYQKP
jgi:hypothetical protein